MPLKQWVRNRVIEIRRFSNIEEWKYVKSSDMIADLGTRKGVTLDQVCQNSEWINGFPWMKLNISEFPTKSVHDITLSKEDEERAVQESSVKVKPEGSRPIIVNQNYKSSILPKEVMEFYKSSSYLIDPNKYRYRNVVRIIAIVMKFINSVKLRVSEKTKRLKPKRSVVEIKNITLTDTEIAEAEKYFYRKATAEIKKSMKKSFYEKFSVERDNILYYTGRILNSHNVEENVNMSNTMKDLCSSTFCVPIVNKHSPVAYSIINETHWHNKSAMHSGVETVWRYVLKKVFIIEGREVVKRVRKNCQRCRYLSKKSIDVAMGPISEHNLAIAPAFYITQVDLAGPFMSFSQHHKRTTVKIWFAIFCCSTTSTISIKVMDDYSSISFVRAFIRFSCEFGYPKLILSDEGSQLIKACETMSMNFQDIKRNLHLNMSVEFQTCPVGGHNMHGRVERTIREVRSGLGKVMQNERLSLLEWETIVAEIANTINNHPLAIGNIVSSYEMIDVLTPNRLRLGRNNDRSPIGELQITNNPNKFMKDKERIFKVWFETWLMSHVPKLTHQPKWFKSDTDVKEGDVVMFKKVDGLLSNNYQYGMITFHR